MKDWLQIVTGCVMMSAVFTFMALDGAYAEDNNNNDYVKECLALHDYSPEKFDTFNWNAASACFHAKSIAQSEAVYAKLREFLEENPHYRGPNWDWERRAEYTCIKRYDLNGIEVCSKPYYLN
jgi:hypothetical protein